MVETSEPQTQRGSTISKWLGPNPQMRLTRWLFLRGLALVYLIAFTSFALQARGLIGHNGILPIESYFQQASQYYGQNDFLQMPSIFWLNQSDAFLMGVCITAVVLSVLVLIGFAQRWLLVVLYALYL